MVNKEDKGKHTGIYKGKEYVEARILWPALGFPEVITADQSITLLLMSKKGGDKDLSSEDVAKYLRYVTWNKPFKCRYCEDGIFPSDKITVNKPKVHGEDDLVLALDFVSLSKFVHDFYKENGLKYLYQIEIETKGLNLQEETYNLFWINPERKDNPHTISYELKFIKDFFVQKRKPGKWYLGAIPRPHEGEYISEYDLNLLGRRPLEPLKDWKEPYVEILHPLFVEKEKDELKIAHLTDSHVCIRADTFQETIDDASDQYGIKKGQYNNYNLQTKIGIEKACKNCDILLLTGDLVDYGRGHDGTKNTVGIDSAYQLDRNWFLFYTLLASGIRYKRPMYTVLGNHDWRLHPYGPISKAYSIAHDLNLTTLQTKHVHGPNADEIWYAQIGEEPLIPYLARMPLVTVLDSIKWYLLVINPFLDYMCKLPGGYALLMLDWAEDERVLELWPDFNLVGLSIAEDSLTDMQKRLSEHFLDQDDCEAKIVGLHATIIGPNPDMEERLMEECLIKCPECKGTGKKKDGADCPCLSRYRTRTDSPNGTSVEKPTHPGKIPLRAGRWEETVDYDNSYPVYGTIERQRSWLIKEFGKKNVSLVLCGHCHRNGAFRLENAGTSDWEGLGPPEVKFVLDHNIVQSIWKGNVEATYSGPLYLNTTSIGPVGYELPHSGARRKLEPGFHEIAVDKTGRIPRKWVFHKSNLPLLRTHWEGYVKKDSKAIDARAHIRWDNDEKKWKCDIIGIYDTKEQADDESDGVFDTPWPEGTKYAVWVKKSSKARDAKVHAGAIIGEYDSMEDADDETVGIFSTDKPWEMPDYSHWECWVKRKSEATDVKVYRGGIIAVYNSQEKADKEKEFGEKGDPPWKKDNNWECWIRKFSKALDAKMYAGGIIGLYARKKDAIHEKDKKSEDPPWEKSDN